jgi:hypothetical protein
MDMTSFSRIKEMAYLKLSVHCKKCGGDFEINEETSEPVESWSEKAAKAAIEQGWSCLEDGNSIVCSNCRDS